MRPRPFRSVLDTIRGHGLTPAELRQRARLALSHKQAFLAQLYLDEAEAQEAALRASRSQACDLCGGAGDAGRHPLLAVRSRAFGAPPRGGAP
ncbi:hypothetical protein [Thermus tenuipuniceus]|uniref:hypothetical protein n=1 Tax=Thermus tenuipuniceus TaxID=2078690 RepID=UPI000CF89CED|nr:hypothetical protein [Thermus tenuipuniceus]